MLDLILSFEKEAREAMRLGAYYKEIVEGTTDLRDKIARAKFISEDNVEQIRALKDEAKEIIHNIVAEGGMTQNA